VRRREDANSGGGCARCGNRPVTMVAVASRRVGEGRVRGEQLGLRVGNRFFVPLMGGPGENKRSARSDVQAVVPC
jgi:hypothetical protein